jgi:hypothetical protein
MRRRQFITLIGGVAAAWPLAARAQQSSNKIPAVGVLWHAGSAEEEGPNFNALVEGFNALGYVDSDDAVLAIAHRDGRTVALDLIAKQPGPPPFDPRYAVARFCDILHERKISKVYGDAFAGQTFRKDFAARDIAYEVRSASASLLYEKLEPVLNAGELELLDQPTLIEQLVSLVWKGSKITHEHGAHDDFATALALAVSVVRAAITHPTPKYHPPYAVSKTGVICDPTMPLGGPQQRQPSATELFYRNGGYGGGHWPGSNPFDREW